MDGNAIETSHGRRAAEQGSRRSAGERAGEYVLDAFLGAGRLGPVWRGHHLADSRRVVRITLLEDPCASECLRLEALQEGAFEDPGVLRVLDAVLDGAVPHIVEELATGGDLASAIVRQGRLSLDRVLAIVRQAAATLARAHARGLVHWDLSPATLYLDEDGRVRVADFRLAKALRPLACRAFGPGGVSPSASWLMTWDYLAPEVRAAISRGLAPEEWSGVADARADVYALGVLLYELLEGERPAGRVALEPEAVDLVFSRTWTARERRYPDAGALYEDLEKLRLGKTDLARPSVHPGAPGSRSVRSSHDYTPAASFWNRVFVLVPALFLAAFLFFVWTGDGGGSLAPRPPAPGEPAGADPLASEDAAVRLGEIRRRIEARPLDVEGGLALLDAFIAATDELHLRDKARAWRDSLTGSAERTGYDVRVRGFVIDERAYRERFHARLEPGRPDVYVKVHHTRDGKESCVFNGASRVVEGWSHVWKTTSASDVPSFRIEWQTGDGLRVELRESDVFGDDLIAEFGAEGGWSILLLSSPQSSAEGHRVAFETDSAFGK